MPTGGGGSKGSGRRDVGDTSIETRLCDATPPDGLPAGAFCALRFGHRSDDIPGLRSCHWVVPTPTPTPTPAPKKKEEEPDAR